MAALGGDGLKLPRVCFDMRDEGSCTRGDACRFSHNRKDLVESRRLERAKNRGSGGKASKAGSKGGTGGDSQRKDGPPPFCLNSLRGACAKTGAQCRFSHGTGIAQKADGAACGGAPDVGVASPTGPR